MANKKGWRKLRVVVELPVRGEYASETRLAHAIAALLSQESKKVLLRIDGPVGKFRVIQFNRIRRPQAKLTPREKIIDEALAMLVRQNTLLEQRVNELEHYTNPHRER
jgi:hypothetical protein